jgi:hypothetical protein
MPYCPQCAAEYVADVTSCAHCQVPLVPELTEDIQLGAEKLAVYFQGKDVIMVTEGPLDTTREIRDVLEAGGVPTRLSGKDEGEDGPPMHMRFKVEIVRDDLQKAAEVMGERWNHFLAAEGTAAGETKEAVLADGAETQCPACGYAFTPQSTETAECPECGLFLGVPAAT